MKINGENIRLTVDRYFQNSGKQAAEKAEKTGADVEDKVHISQEARDLAASGGSGGRAKRVERLKNLVESGQYKVDPDKVAEAIIKDAVQNGGKNFLV